MFDKCIKNEMGEDMRKDLLKLQQQVVDNTKEIHNINYSHIPLHIRSKLCCLLSLINITCRGRRDRDRMVVGYTTIYAISASHH
jgi:hypothetical protein